MKKILLYFFGFIFICFILPALLTKTNTIVISNDNNEQVNIAEDTEEQLTYNKYGTIQLLHKDTGEIEAVELDKYLYNVVSAEMPVDYEIEALKAQRTPAKIAALRGKKVEDV